MPYRVLIKRKAQRQLDKIRQEDRERIIGAVFGLGDEPRPRRSQRLQGRPGYRLRIGDYRKAVTILQIGHRRDIYR